MWLACRVRGQLCRRATHAGPVALRVARATPIFRGDGTVATWDDLVNAAANADVVMLGGKSRPPLGLAAAAAGWGRHHSAPSTACLSMEFFESDEQSLVDDFTSGLIDEPTFLHLVACDRRKLHQRAPRDGQRPGPRISSVVAAYALVYVRLARCRGLALRALLG